MRTGIVKSKNHSKPTRNKSAPRSPGLLAKIAKAVGARPFSKAAATAKPSKLEKNIKSPAFASKPSPKGEAKTPAVAAKAPIAAKAPKAAKPARPKKVPSQANPHGSTKNKQGLHVLNGMVMHSSFITKDASICREVACESLSTTSGYCRLHYIKNWKKIKLKGQILSQGKLNIFIEELVGKYPEKYIEAIKHDLAHDKEFMKVVQDLELGESVEEFESDSENADVLIDSIRRDFDDETETF